VVMTLASFLLISGASYSIWNSPQPGRAAAHVGIFIAIGVIFFGTLSTFKKGSGVEVAAGVSVVDRLLEELSHDEVASQLDAVSHLTNVDDKRIVPALTGLLERTKSDQVIETIAEALGKMKDTRAAPALRSVLQKDHDPFLKLTLAAALVKLKDKAGFTALTDILKQDESVLLRSQALELLKAESGQDFGYNPEKSAGENKAALERLSDWVNKVR
jgi:HEAT repeat protein